MQVTLKIFRYNPEVDTKGHYDHFTLEAEPTDRILDLLEKVKGTEDGTLGFRRACAHGVCGSDAIRINGLGDVVGGRSQHGLDLLSLDQATNDGHSHKHS